MQLHLIGHTLSLSCIKISEVLLFCEKEDFSKYEYTNGFKNLGRRFTKLVALAI